MIVDSAPQPVYFSGNIIIPEIMYKNNQISLVANKVNVTTMNHSTSLSTRNHAKHKDVMLEDQVSILVCYLPQPINKRLQSHDFLLLNSWKYIVNIKLRWGILWNVFYRTPAREMEFKVNSRNFFFLHDQTIVIKQTHKIQIVFMATNS